MLARRCVRQLSHAARGRHQASGDGHLPQHDPEPEGGCRAEHPSGRELRARGHAAVLGRPEAAQHRRHAACSSAASRLPTYDQATVRGFAAVFTGWDWNNTGCGDSTYTCCMYDEEEGWGTYFWCGPSNYNDPPWQLPMQPIEHYHDNTSDKQLLIYPGVALPGGVLVARRRRAGRDDRGARQHLQSSERRSVHRDAADRAPGHQQSDAGLRAARRADVQQQRHAACAATCKRGDQGDPARSRSALRPVAAARHVRQAARAAAQDHADVARDGRALDRRTRSASLRPWPPIEEQIGQAPLRSPTVFNFFKPDFAQPGEVADRAGSSAPSSRS